MPDKYYTVGELSRISGATIRTIQYYDRTGLLPAQRDEKSGLRRYTQEDMILLQQILFYKRLGIPLRDIKENIMDTESMDDIKKLLRSQSEILFQKEMEFKMNQIIIETVLTSIESDPEQNLDSIMQMMLRLNRQSITEYANVDFDEETKQVFEDSNNDYQEVFDFYWRWKQLVMETASFKLNNSNYENDTGFELGKKWHEFQRVQTKDDPEIEKALVKGLEHKEEWPEEDRYLYNFTEDYIEGTRLYYLKKAGEVNDKD